MKWIISIIVLCSVTGVIMFNYRIKENSAVIPTTVFILFLMSVIYKLLFREGDNHGKRDIEVQGRTGVPQERPKPKESKLKRS